MKKNRKADIRSMTLLSVFSAIILLMSLVPQIGFITIMPGVSLTLVHIPVLIGIFLLEKKDSWILGLMYGLGSMIAAYLYAASPFDLAFQYPWIAIIPRVLFVIATAYIFEGFKWIFVHVKHAKSIVYGIVTFIAIFAIFFGVRAIVHNVAYADYNNEQGRRAVLEAEIATENESDSPNYLLIAENTLAIVLIDAEADNLLSEASTKEANINQVTIPVSLAVSAIFITLYFAFITRGKKDETIYPSVIILGTLSHTIFVLLTVALFSPSAFTATFGDNTGVIQIVYSIAAANGLIEALAAVVVGTPIVIGLKQFAAPKIGVNK